MNDDSNTSGHRTRRIASSLRSIEAAAIAGLLHSALSLFATALLLRSPDPSDGDAAMAEWYSDNANQRSLITAVNLIVGSTIAFLWFVAVIRRRVGDRENRFFGTVFLGSALLLSGAWLVAGVLIATPAITARSFDIAPDANMVASMQAAGITMAAVVATRLEAVFIISTTTVGRLSGVFPRWLLISGYTVGLILFLVPVPSNWLTWVFPVWVAIVSLVLLSRRNTAEISTPISGP
jgi:hypothetical protein